MIKQTIKQLLGLKSPKITSGEKPAAYYDEVFASSIDYKVPFWRSRDYFLWTVIVDRLRLQDFKSLFEIGCGTGQFAEFLVHSVAIDYCGMDLSSEAIQLCNEKQLVRCRFETGDGLDSNLLDENYDVVVCTEVLEHIERDLELVERIPSGVRCLCTVPNFPYVSHVRHFRSEDEVRQRYSHLFDSLDVWGLPGSHCEGTVYFLLDGVRANKQ